ncbi:MAG: glycoside hydrolase family 66 protein [Candidatus Cryptobacteroides sp.]
MNLKNILLYFPVLVLVTFCRCTPAVPELSFEESLKTNTTIPEVTITTDKAVYAPGTEVVVYSSERTDGLGVRYWHLGDIISEQVLTGDMEWTWTPPAEDFQGYYIEIVARDTEGKLHTVGSCGVDVSSTWTRFPRYGYLGTFCDCPELKRETVLYNLNRHHINALQYYEWAYDHHHPLCGTPENPEPVWDKYLQGSTCELEVIQGYIRQAHNYNIASMFYDLCNGAFEWCEEDGVGSTWYTYKDKEHQTKDFHTLPVPPFRSNLYLIDPNLDEWCDYFAKQISDVYKVFDFDGFHIDQLGYRGKIYDYNGNEVDLTTGYRKVISKMKQSEPDKLLAFNAVSGYGQDQIAAAPVDFLYNEVWDHNFNAFKTTLDENRSIDPSRNTVIAAYLHSTNSGYFNTPAVLLADAVLFAMGASHIELGENLISDIYWPGCCLKVPEELEAALIEYYDFLVGYENLLRDNVRECKLNVTSEDVAIGQWDGLQGKINVYSTQKSGNIIMHLLNFTDAPHMNWHDSQRNQAEPALKENFEIEVPCLKTVKRVWAASPDVDGGIPRNLEYKVSESGTTMTVKVPSLKYWTMIVIE